jgi:putative ABC transport system permease protein
MARMKLSGVRYILGARRESRAALVQDGFAVLGIAVGVALLFASQVSSTSLTHSVQELTSQIVGHTRQLQIQARGPGGFDEGMLRSVRAIPGVQTALPVLEQQVNVTGPRGQRSVDLIGADPRFVNASGPLLRRFSAKQLAAQQAIALPIPVAHGIGVGPLEPVKLQIGARTVETLLAATLGGEDIGGLTNSPVAFAPVRYAQRLSGMTGRITRIFVKPRAGHEAEVKARLAQLAAAAHLNLEPGDFDSLLFAVAVAPESKSEALFSAIAALVGFMFALTAMLVTVPSRRRLIESVRLHGASQSKTVSILLFDAAIIGGLSCVLGLILGEVLSVAVFHSPPGYLSFAFPVGNDRIVTWQSFAYAIAAGMLAALVGVFWPLREIIGRTVQTGEPSQSRRQSLLLARLTAGVLGIAATTVVLLVDAQAAVIGNVTLVVALVCLLPLLFDGLVVVFDYAQRPLNQVATGLALTELQAPQIRVRSLAIATTAAIAVFGMVEFQGTQANLTRGLDASARDLDTTADVWVAPGGESNAFSTTAFAAVDPRTLTSLPGVRAIGVYRGSFLNWDERRLWVLAPPASNEHPIPASQLQSSDPALAAARIRAGGWAVLSQGLASEHHLRVGQPFTLPSPQPITLWVAGLSTNLGWPPGAIILNSEDYARAWASTDPSAYEIHTTSGASAATVRKLVARALGPQTALIVRTAAEREQHHFALAAQGLARLTQIRLLVLIAAVLAVIGAMGAMLWQRRDTVASLKCHGFREGVLWAWLLCESAVLLAAGCSIGAAFGLYAQLLGSHFLSTVTGFPITFGIEGGAAITSFLLVTAVAVAIVSLPGYLVVRVAPSTISPAY